MDGGGGVGGKEEKEGKEKRGKRGWRGEVSAYWKVVKVRENKEDAEKGDETENDATHWRSSARRRVDFAPPVAAECRQCHEAPTDNISNPQRHEFAVGAKDHALQAVTVAISAAQTFGRHRGLEEAEKSDQEGGAHSLPNVLHMRGDKGPFEWKGGAGARLHVAEDFEPLLIPATFPGEDGGENNDDESIGYIRNGWVARLQAVFELPTTHMYK